VWHVCIVFLSTDQLNGAKEIPNLMVFEARFVAVAQIGPPSCWRVAAIVSLALAPVFSMVKSMSWDESLKALKRTNTFLAGAWVVNRKENTHAAR
jgi:hypothetical protein